MYKVMTILGTRPEIIKMSRVIPLFDQFTNHILVHTGQNYDHELNQIFFEQLGVRKPDFFLGANGKDAAHTIGNVISKSSDLMVSEKPDAVLIYGDTNSGLAAIAAKKLKIPIFHMEAGNRSFDQRVPEEINRKIIDHTSDVNFVLSSHARQYLLREGIRPELIFKTGSHLWEVLETFRSDIEGSAIMSQLGLKNKEFFLVSLHREENVDTFSNLSKLIEALNALSKKYRQTIIVSLHPRTKSRLKEFGIKVDDPLIQLREPFGYFDYIHLQTHARCVLSDSGTLTEEVAFLGFPAIMVREAHERPEGMDAGLLFMSGISPNQILESIDILESLRKSIHLVAPKVIEYSEVPVSEQILKIVLSYIEYINRTVWGKSEII
jgi:UDP-N-acetylglucosamine 2-epimerase (non-hydrolysing)